MTRVLRAGLALGLLAAPLAARTSSSQERPAASDDYFSFKFVADPALAPDGKQVVYTVTRVDRALNRRVSSIWLVPADGSAPPRQLTLGSVSSSAPLWRPDGRAIAFTSVRVVAGDSSSTRPQLYLLSLDGGEPRRLTSLPNGVGGCSFSPDGGRLVCLSRTGPSDRMAPSSDVRHYTGLSYKFNDTGWFDDRKSHLWIVDAMTGKATQLTSGDRWNDSDPVWSPDGTKLAFVSNRTGRESDGDEDTDVWVVPVTGGEPVRISDHPDSDGSPRWSPDGRTIAFIGRNRDGDPPMIWRAPSAGGSSSTLLYPAAELFPSDLQWAETGAALYFNAQNHGETHLYRLDIATRQVRPITKGPRAVRRLSLDDARGTIAYTANDFTHLDELYVAKRDGTGERRLTSVNDSLFATLTLMPVERMTYLGADGWVVDGFLVKPVGWQARKSYPMVLSVHGGPAGMYGVDWFHEFHVYSGRGWAVFFTNPRGSTGYGHEFERGIAGEWGGKDYVDVMNGVDAVLAANPWIDKERLGVTGGSYGGFMTNWIVGHTGRFKAAVTLRSVANLVSDEGTRDGAYGHCTDFGGDLFQKFDEYWDRSPLKYARNVTTPILILHSDNDYRVPLEQGEQWFRALRHFGKTAELVIFPRENHNLTRTGEPRHLVESLDWQVHWFSRYLDGKPDAVAPDRR
ncbi:MAG TPA: S9 family peptidase [Gemmatimonadales bacterium]|jgi:dipeptidyl aminopeptidase/acylaminoacyl peptidase|nr:S9 family peptidase [Gemmatimonadales bacterium]